MKLLLTTLLATGCLLAAGSALAQPPGSPAGCTLAAVDILEGPTDSPPAEHIGPVPLGCPVYGGYVVLVESPDPALRNDPRNWSDIVAFTTGGPSQPGQLTDTYFYISDSPDPTTNVENGITPADLAYAGLTPTDILANPLTVFIPEGLNAAAPDVNLYAAAGPGGQIVYSIHSDPPEHPTAAPNASWGQVKVYYR